MYIQRSGKGDIIKLMYHNYVPNKMVKIIY